MSRGWKQAVCIAVTGLLALIHLGTVQSKVNLFQQGTINDLSSSASCADPIIRQMSSERPGTGARKYKVSERKLQFCPNFCGNSTTIDKFCGKHEPKFVAQFGAVVQSDRCCDKRNCYCICLFACKTFEHKLKELQAKGYKRCAWASSREVVNAKATKLCKAGRAKLRCHTLLMRFLCPQQFVCVEGRCLSCVNPNCVTKKDKKITKMVLTAQNRSEQVEVTTLLRRSVSRKSIRGNDYTEDLEDEVDDDKPKGNVSLGIVIE